MTLPSSKLSLISATVLAYAALSAAIICYAGLFALY